MVKAVHPVGNHLIDPQRIRALATGIGQTQQRSMNSGERRAKEIAEHMPPGVASKAVGYPAKDPMMEGMETMMGGERYCEPDGALSIDGKV